MRPHDRQQAQVDRTASGPPRVRRSVGLNPDWLRHLQRTASAGGVADQGRVQRASLEQAPTRNPAEQATEAATEEPASGIALRMHDHEGVELRADDEDQLAGYVRHLAATGRADVFRLLRGRLRRKGFATQADHVQHVWDRADHAESESSVRVPRVLHFIWLGDKPGDGVVDNLKAWKDRAEGSDWTLNLWTDTSGPALAELQKTFGDRLKIHSDSDRLVEEGAGEKNFEWYLEAKVKKAYNLASDILRYTVLKKYGGVYMDVDIAPGAVRLASAPEMKMHGDEVPLFAPRLRDKGSVHTALGHEGKKRKKKLTQADLVEAADVRYGAGLLNNNFIVSPESAFMDELLKALPDRRTDMKHEYTEDVMANMLSVLAPKATGPDVVEKVMEKFTAGHHGVVKRETSEGTREGVIPGAHIDREEFRSLFDPEILEFWKELEWVTPESENQLDGKEKSSSSFRTKINKFLRKKDKK
ncbi:TcdA/TcdB catalytic glycosyltransferase domain-containing protein [Streptomyces sp. NPDC048057]|uniref:TcdA/TcdB catalytic glycosyltransferase domain-containing protein n=1 Tax=Streptomyces sp. NPDC048057 TaxID=3155628 RepID=UPI0034005DB4